MNNALIPYTVIVADGTFPQDIIPLSYLKNASRIICCDGSAQNLVTAGYVPDAIVGDMDSLSTELKSRFANRLFPVENQSTNDLTKAVDWCREMNYNDIVIVGATGKREDHTIGNISLLADYAEYVNVKMVTDTGIFLPYLKSCNIPSFKNQQVSIFSLSHETAISSTGLKFPLTNLKIDSWWVATLNEALGDSFSLEFEEGKLIVFLKFK